MQRVCSSVGQPDRDLCDCIVVGGIRDNQLTLFSFAVPIGIVQVSIADWLGQWFAKARWSDLLATWRNIG